MDGSLKPLTEHERLLLSASLDGALDAAEDAQVHALLQRADAQAYVKQMRALRALVAQHGAQQAPAALQASVMAALGEQPQGKIIPMPRATWATAIAALAAMLIVGTALYFAPGMIGPGPQEPQLPVARGNEARDGGALDQPAARPGETLKAMPGEDRHKNRANEKNDVTRDLDAADNAEASRMDSPKIGAPAKDAAPPAPTAPGGQGGSPESARAKKGDGGPAEGAGKVEPADKSREDAKGDPRDRDLEKRKEVAPRPAEAKNAKDDEQERDDGKAMRRAAGDDSRADDGEKPGDARGQWDGDTPAEVVISLKTESGLAAQNDVLRVGAMFGTAKLGELPEQGMEDVIVEVEESRLVALIAALQRLTGQQSYGKLEVPVELAKPTATAPGGGKSAREVLPEELRNRIEGKEPEPKPAAEANAPARKTRLKVRLP